MARFSPAQVWNFLQFQLGWFALVCSAALGHSWLGTGVLAVLIAIHLHWFSRRNEWLLLLIVGAGGWLWESALQTLGLLSYVNHPATALAAPVWMAALWINFASTLKHSLSWLQGQVFIAALLGAVGGPLAFLAGDKLGAVTFVYPVITTAVLMLGWAILTPLCLYLAGWCDDVDSRRDISIVEAK